MRPGLMLNETKTGREPGTETKRQPTCPQLWLRQVNSYDEPPVDVAANSDNYDDILIRLNEAGLAKAAEFDAAGNEQPDE